MNENNELVTPVDNQRAIDAVGLPTEALNAIIRKLNEKSQSVTRLFSGNYSLSMADLNQLLMKISQEFHYCQVLSKSETVSLILEKNERHDFRTFQEFSSFDTSQGKKTTSLQVEIIYNVVRNVVELPEKYSIQVSAQNMTNSSNVYFAPITFARVGEFPTPPAPLAVSIVYNNYILGKNIIANIEGWESALDKKRNKIIEWLQKHSYRLRELLTYFSVFAGIVASHQLISVMIVSDNFRLATWISYSCYVFFFFVLVGSLISRFAERSIDRYSDRANIIITKGDSKDDSSISRKNLWNLIKAGIGVIWFAVQIVISFYAESLMKTAGLI